jgi:transglutaminase-like putative cysteine protease
VIDLDVVHETRYAYAEPVSLAHHIAYLRPLDDQHQRLLAFELQVLPPAPMTVRTDAAGNAQCHFSVVRPHDTLAVRATSRVRVAGRFGALDPASSPPWDALAARLRYVARAPFDPAVEYALPSPYVPRLEELRTYAVASFAPGRPVLDGALELMGRIHADFEYHGESTEVDTPLAQALAQRSGVCQDFAHLMAGAMRMLGLPVRYISGYLLTQPPEGGAALVGADASHAWVQVYAPSTAGVPADGWVDLDPTNDVVPGTGHVRVAVGRDYGDVAPLRGVIRGGGRHALTVAVRTRVAGPLVAIAPQDQDPP